jgi:hypothetical protein
LNPFQPKSVTLTFDLELHPEEKKFHQDLSACALVGNDLWLGSDELTTVERVTRDEDGNFGEHKTFPLSDYVDLPSGDESEEVDIEGIAYTDHCLWVTGSHSLKRKKAEGAKPKKAIKKLAEMERETNRFLIARIPLVFDPDTGHSELFKTCVHPDDPTRSLRAAQLFGTGAGNMLVDALRLDEHLGRFLSIPCKENGFDVEGIAVIGKRVLLGLRGPVLRGWAVIVEIEMEELCENVLKLVRIGPHKRFYRKHFLDLQGLGIRDLCLAGDDLLILAGPTMDLEGAVRVLRWRKIRDRDDEMILAAKDLEPSLDFSSPNIQAIDKNHAEGLTLVNPENRDEVIVLYDGPGPERQKQENAVMADIFELTRD